MKYGKLRLRSLAFVVAADFEPKSVRVTLDGVELTVKHRMEGHSVAIELAADTVLGVGKKLDVAIA